MSFHRNILRASRKREKIELEVAEELAKTGELELVQELERKGGHHELLRSLMGQALKQAVDHDFVLNFVRERVGEIRRMQMLKEMYNSPFQDDMLKKACGDCKRHAGAQQTCACEGVSHRVNDRLLEDEYAMLAIRAGEEAQEKRQRDYIQKIANANRYRGDLNYLQNEKHRELEMQQQQKQREREEAFRRHQQHQLALQREKQMSVESKRACMDELDTFCHQQEMRLLDHQEAEREEARRREQVQLERERALREKEERQRQNQLEQAKANKEFSDHMIQRKMQEEQQHREQDKKYFQMAEQASREREAARARERMAIQEKQDRIFRSVGMTIGKIEEERKAALEQAFERWEYENKLREEQREREKAVQRQRDIYELNLGRDKQVQRKQQHDEHLRNQEFQYAKNLRNRINLENQKEQQKRQEWEQQQSMYKDDLMQQMEREKRTRRERLLIGMNDVERKMNRNLLNNLKLTTYEGHHCISGVCKNYCTCSTDIKQQLFQSPYTQSARNT